MSSFNAFVSGEIEFGLANLHYAFGFKSLDALKKHGGMVEWYQSRRPKQKTHRPA